MSSSVEALLIVQLTMLIAALGHYLPMSMRQLDIGIAGYFALGAYASSVATSWYDLPFPVALVLGALAGMAGALIIDSLATRVKLRGFAYAIFSLGFAESLRIILRNVPSLGGAGGFAGMQPYTTLPLVAGLVVCILIGFWWLDRTRLGQLKQAIHDDELIVPVFGVRLLAAKMTIFAMGGGLGGLAGGLYAHYVLFIRPDDFGFEMLIALQLPIVFGGLDRFYGAVFGFLLLGFLPEVVRGLDQYRLIFTALATLVVLVIRPSGLITHDTVRRVKSFLTGGRAKRGGDAGASSSQP